MSTPVPTNSEQPQAPPATPEQPPSAFKPDPPQVSDNAERVSPAPELRDLVESVRQLEQTHHQVREQLDRISHERAYRDFSMLRLLAAMLQAIVIGLLVVAVADWVYGVSAARQLVTLAFAGVLQLGTLTAVSAARWSS